MVIINIFNLIIIIIVSVARLVEEPDLLPALVATVSRHLVNYPNPARCCDHDDDHDGDGDDDDEANDGYDNDALESR